jgi:hypothetical protein
LVELESGLAEVGDLLEAEFLVQRGAGGVGEGHTADDGVKAQRARRVDQMAVDFGAEAASGGVRREADA